MSGRVGIGYDSHRFAEGRRLVLGGVEIDHPLGLTGPAIGFFMNRDTYALIDALLGAAGLGDLGTHFPPDDERWRDADSLGMLRTVLGMLPGSVRNADLSVIAEQPRLGDHREEMERNLVTVLGAPVSVKATTNEGMGFVGRGEGIACLAVALIETGD